MNKNKKTKLVNSPSANSNNKNSNSLCESNNKNSKISNGEISDNSKVSNIASHNTNSKTSGNLVNSLSENSHNTNSKSLRDSYNRLVKSSSRISRNTNSKFLQNKNSHNTKGYLHTVEVVIAASILVVGMALVFRPYASTQIDDMKSQGYHILEYLDNSGKLRDYVANNNTVLLDNEIKKFLTYNLKTEICTNSNVAGATSYDTGCSSSIFEKNVVIINYYISGYKTADGLVFSPKKMRLLIWQ